MQDSPIRRHHVQISGDPRAPALLFAHGFGCDQRVWRFVAPAFEPYHRVVLFDHLGSGRSSPDAYSPTRHATLQGYADDVVELIERLGLRDVVFVGHSVGSTIGLLASLKNRGAFSRLVLLAPSPCYLNFPPDYFGGFERSELEELLRLIERNDLAWASFLAPVVMKNGERPELREELQQSFCSMEPGVAHRFAAATFLSDHRGELEGVRVPSLIMQCRDDSVAPPQVGEYLHRHLAGSTLRRLAATGHCPHMSHPEETVDVIRDYLREAAMAA
jgi:sigma-B regulation protein RsbQ